MTISAIVACAAHRVIGKDNQIPWYLPADLQYFKKTTLNHHIIMGRNSFESIGRSLPKRTNMVITRKPFYAATDCLIFHSVEEALEFADNNGETEIFIIGGGEIYRQTIDYWDKLYLTEVNVELDGDVFFPELEKNEWIERSSEHHFKDAKNEYDYTFKILERKP